MRAYTVGVLCGKRHDMVETINDWKDRFNDRKNKKNNTKRKIVIRRSRRKRKAKKSDIKHCKVQYDLISDPLILFYMISYVVFSLLQTHQYSTRYSSTYFILEYKTVFKRPLLVLEIDSNHFFFVASPTIPPKDFQREYCCCFIVIQRTLSYLMPWLNKNR